MENPESGPQSYAALFLEVQGDHEAIRYMDHEVECICSRSVLKTDLEIIENN